MSRHSPFIVLFLVGPEDLQPSLGVSQAPRGLAVADCFEIEIKLFPGRKGQFHSRKV